MPARAVPLLLLLLLALVAGCAGPAPAPPGMTVPQVNLVLFQRRWYEIASTRRPGFEAGCACSKADYLLHREKLVIHNTCRQLVPSGEEKSRTYLAELVPGTGNAQLILHFRWPFKGGYWVIGLDPEYQWAVVGAPDRQNLWVLSRQPRLDPGLLVQFLEQTKAKSFPVERMKMTEQSCQN